MKLTYKLKKGEFIYLVGKTGSGKSSLLRTLYRDIEVKHGKELLLVSIFIKSKREKYHTSEEN